jgi:hypothetical protein
MSRYFLDRVQLDQALQLQAQPVLEALAADDNLRSGFLRRFESDDPPPYEESTNEEGIDDAPPLPFHGALPVWTSPSALASSTVMAYNRLYTLATSTTQKHISRNPAYLVTKGTASSTDQRVISD